MIQLHRLAHEPEPFHVNPDLIATIEAAPDCHVTLTTGTKLIVAETVEEVVDAVRDWRVSILAAALSLTAR
jgi:flagellar protein FlbD